MESATATPILEARNVSKVFGSGVVSKSETIALEGFSLRVDGQHPSILAIVGESGSGKTTLALAILRLIPSEGRVVFLGQLAPSRPYRFKIIVAVEAQHIKRAHFIPAA